MAVDMFKFNPVVAPIVLMLPDMKYFLEKINMIPDIYVTIGLANAFFSISLKEDKKQFTSMQDGQQYTFRVSPQDYIDSPATCHNIVQRGLDHLHIDI